MRGRTRELRRSEVERVVSIEDEVRSGRDAVLTAANGIVGAMEFMGGLAGGRSLFESFDRAYENCKRRARMLARTGSGREGDE